MDSNFLASLQGTLTANLLAILGAILILVVGWLIKQRINNQSGVFSILSSEDIKKSRFMHQNDSFSEKLVKIKIPSDKIPDLRNDLNMLGVNAFSIFPELEGLCAYLQWRFFEYRPNASQCKFETGTNTFV